MSSPTSTYSASVYPDITNYMMAYATGNDGCIETITAIFQPSSQNISGQYVSGVSNVNAGFFYQPVNVPQGVGVNIIFFSTTIPQDTFAIYLTFTTTKRNTYQLASINTLPPNPNYAFVVIIQLVVTVQSAQYTSAQALLQAFTSFASSQCQTQSQPQISYNGQGFQVLYQYTQYTGTFFLALLVAFNQTAFPNAIQVTVTMAGNTVVNAIISTPGLEYAYFLFRVSVTLPGE